MFEKENRYVIAVDLDNTLTNGEPFWKGVEVTPHIEHIEIIRNLYFKGCIIIIHTARLWEWSCETVGWLIKNKVPFHGIMMGKCGGDFYCDDKNCSFEDLKKILGK